MSVAHRLTSGDRRTMGQVRRRLVGVLSLDTPVAGQQVARSPSEHDDARRRRT